jgi:transcription termination factor Rho
MMLATTGNDNDMTSRESDKDLNHPEVVPFLAPAPASPADSTGFQQGEHSVRLARPRLRARIPRTKVPRNSTPGPSNPGQGALGQGNSGQNHLGQQKQGQRESSLPSPAPGGGGSLTRNGKQQRPDRHNQRRTDARYNDNRDNFSAEEELEIIGTEPPLSINELNKMSLSVLMEVAKEKEIEGSRMSKQELIFSILKKHGLSKNRILGEGVVEILPDSFGFLRNPHASYQPGPCDIYLSPTQIRRFNLRTGDTVSGDLRAPKDNERYFALAKVDKVNFHHPDNAKRIQPFEDLTPLFPTEMLGMEVGNGSTEDITARILDLVSPIGKGQRGLIVSPPKAGKTMMMQNIAHSIAANHPECKLIVLLIDERPEEVTEMTRSVRGEVVASTFDEPASRHVQVAEIVIEKAKRLVEQGENVVILLDSITRLARAYNTVSPSSGKVLTGGVDAAALQRPKRFFGAARNIENGGSLTIIATALVETGSKMDEVIFEEFKGTGNMEAHLERRIAEKRVFPAINIRRSGTRREELMMTPVELKQRWIIRKVLHPMDEIAASEFLLDRLKRTKTNEDFFGEMKG